MKCFVFEEFGLFLFPSPNRLGASGVTDELGCSRTTINFTVVPSGALPRERTPATAHCNLSQLPLT